MRPARERDGPVAEGEQGLDERHRQLAVAGGQEEQAPGGSAPLLLGELQQPVPARALLGLGLRERIEVPRVASTFSPSTRTYVTRSSLSPMR